MVSGQLMALCPSHPDRNPSLAVKEADNGNVLITCHGGCDSRDVVAALGLEMSDLFAEEATKDNKVVVARYPYIDGSTGEVLWEKIRYYPKTFAQIHYDRVGKEVWGLPKDVQPWLYRAPHFKKALDDGEPIWVVEGEADVHAIEAMGGYGTTQTMGAGKGKWKPFHTSLLRRASEVRIIVDLDDDRKNQRTGEDENIGRNYAFEVRDALTAEGIKVTMWRSPVGKDASDALHAGKKLEDFQKYRMPRQRVTGVMGHDLMVKEFPPLVFAVEGILPQGVAILGAPPKAAKSFLALDMAVGVATGGVCLSHLPCTLGDVLYVGLEDSERRLKDRIALLMENHVPDLSRIEFQSIDSEWQVGTQGRAWMEEWAEAAESPRLIVIDTLGKAEPELSATKDSYRAEQEMMLRYKRFADRHDLTVLFIHHDRKSTDDDWLNKFSGTKGITGGADTLLYIDFKRGEREGTLRVDGRDVKADDLSLTKVRGRPFWTVIKAPNTVQEMPEPESGLSSVQRAIVGTLKSSGPLFTVDLRAKFAGKNIGEDLAQLEMMQLVTAGPAGYSAGA